MKPNVQQSSCFPSPYFNLPDSPGTGTAPYFIQFVQSRLHSNIYLGSLSGVQMLALFEMIITAVR